MFSADSLNHNLSCGEALYELLSRKRPLSLATEASSHASGNFESVIAQPYLYAGPGFGNPHECPLVNCVAGMGVVPFASLCVPPQCSATELTESSLHRPRNNTHFLWLQEAQGQLLKNVNSKRHNWTDMQDMQWDYIQVHKNIGEVNHFLGGQYTCQGDVTWNLSILGKCWIAVMCLSSLLFLLGTCLLRRQPKTDKQEQDSQTTPPQQHSFPLFQGYGTQPLEKDIDENKYGSPQRISKRTGSSLELSDTDENKKTSPTNALVDQYESNDLLGPHPSLSPPTPWMENSDDEDYQKNSYKTNREQEKELGSNGIQTPSVLWGSYKKRVEYWWWVNALVESFDGRVHWKRLWAARSGKNSSLQCLDGIRTLSILWIMLGHVVAIWSSNGFLNPADFLPPRGVTSTSLGQFVFAARFSVDTFLLVSGFLAVLVLLKRLPTSSGNNSLGAMGRWIPPLVIYRLVRIVPLYGICLVFWWQLAPLLLYVGNSITAPPALWDYGWHHSTELCNEWWWTNVLFINNWVPFNRAEMDTCFFHSWYLAVDLQLFLLAPLLIWAHYHSLQRHPDKKWYQTRGSRATLLLLLTSISSVAYLTYNRGWSANSFDGQAVVRFHQEGYDKPFVRAQGYFIGILLGMWYHEHHEKQQGLRSLQPRINIIGTRVAMGVAVVVLTMVIFGRTGAYNRRPCEYNEWPSSVFAPLHQETTVCGSSDWSPWLNYLYTVTSGFLWSGAVAIIIFLCVSDSEGGRTINTILSHPIFVPFSKLSFGAYLVHPIITSIWTLSSTQKMQYSDFNFAMTYMSICCVTFAISLLLSLLVEFPIMSFSRRILEHYRSAKKDTELWAYHNDPETRSLLPPSEKNGFHLPKDGWENVLFDPSEKSSNQEFPCKPYGSMLSLDEEVKPF